MIVEVKHESAISEQGVVTECDQEHARRNEQWVTSEPFWTPYCMMSSHLIWPKTCGSGRLHVEIQWMIHGRNEHSTWSWPYRVMWNLSTVRWLWWEYGGLSWVGCALAICFWRLRGPNDHHIEELILWNHSLEWTVWELWPLPDSQKDLELWLLLTLRWLSPQMWGPWGSHSPLGIDLLLSDILSTGMWINECVFFSAALTEWGILKHWAGWAS